MSSREEKIIELRRSEALKNNLMGWSGKIGIVLRNFGQPIIEQSTGIGSDEIGHQSSSLNDYLGYSIDNLDDELPTIRTMEVYDDSGEPLNSPDSPEWTVEKHARKHYNIGKIGQYFQLIQNGINLEIKYVDEHKELLVNFQGNKVYQEVSSELYCYVPSKEWEKVIDQLYKTAQKREIESRKLENEKQIAKAAKNKAKWLDDMVKFWGFEV